MSRSCSGRYEVTRVGGEEVRAFIPDALPPSPPIDLSGPRLALLERAVLSIGRLDSVATLLPDPGLFLYAYVRREAVLSSQIEGTQSSLSDLLLFELEEAPGVPFNDVVEVSNYVAALEHGVMRLRGGVPLCCRLLHEMHEQLMQRGRGSAKEPGQFRSSQNWIGGTRPGNAHFVPPPPGHVSACMAELERFLNEENTGLPHLIRVALAHVQFETIHPFLDGNGRLGRLLIALLLHRDGLLTQPLLYLSLYLKQHRKLYYELLDGVRADAHWGAWVDFFLEGVEQTAQGAVQTAGRLVALFEEDTRRIHATGRTASTTRHALDALRRRPVINLKQLCTDAGMTFPSASKAMGRLIDAGIARELTGQRRNRVFVYDAYIAILNEGGEP
ncbi:MAG TPA: Fic family protein [Kiritimatiellia bacterium]|nr:Fic family protein [Kiritimatiellia bacterium]HMO97518.1 Fic family protein [Kiritimatiellia bacterium]